MMPGRRLPRASQRAGYAAAATPREPQQGEGEPCTKQSQEQHGVAYSPEAAAPITVRTLAQTPRKGGRPRVHLVIAQAGC
jgi:hypothetical protein